MTKPERGGDLMVEDLARLTEPRLQLHWAAQVLVAVADAEVPRAEDDSQANLGYDARLAALVGRQGRLGRALALRPRDATLLELRDRRIEREFALEGRGLYEALAWAAEGSPGDPLLRDYEMPPHGVSKGEAFHFQDPPALAALDAWCRLAQETLLPAVGPHPGTREVRLWPHHFDFGALILLRQGADPLRDPSIGIGMSLGDSTYPEPYFYVNPYGLPERPAALPELPGDAFWSPDFLGAILLGRAASAEGKAPDFLERAVAIGQAVLSSP